MRISSQLCRNLSPIGAVLAVAASADDAVETLCSALNLEEIQRLNGELGANGVTPQQRLLMVMVRATPLHAVV